MSYFNFFEAHGGLDPTAEQPDDEHSFACACGDPGCRADDRDADNIRIGYAFYAAECPVGNQLDQIVSGRVAQAKRDEARDDFNRTRR